MEWNWHSLSYEEKLKKRYEFQIRAPHDKEYQAILKELCRRDPVFFIEAFCWTYDPKQEISDLPFILYVFQKRAVAWLEQKVRDGEIGLIEKARQMGMTWLIMTYIYYNWLFVKDFITICGSRKEEIVDKSDNQACLFYKLDYQLRRTPKWLLPKGFNIDKHRRHLILVNPENKNVIIGESSNANFARGATANLCYFDEFAVWPDAASSWMSASRAAKTRICCSTPAPNCFFKTLRFSDQMKENNRVLTIQWREHPSYDEAWYEKQKSELTEEELAQEVDLSYDVSGRGRVYEEFDLVPIGNYKYDPQLPLYVAWDYGRDQTAIIWAQKNLVKKEIYIIDTYQNSNLLIDFYIPFINGYIPPDSKYKISDYTKEEMAKIKEHALWKKATHFGDPSGKQKTITSNDSAIQMLNKAGIHVFTNDKANSFPARRDRTKMLMRQLFVDGKNVYFIDAIKQSMYPQRKEGSQATSEILRPIHNQNSHFRSSLEYLAVNIKLDSAPPRKFNYLNKLKQKDGIDRDANGNKFLTKEQKDREKSKRIIRYSYKGY